MKQKVVFLLCIKEVKNKYGDDHINLADPYHNLAIIYRVSRNFEKSDEYDQLALNLRVKKYGKIHKKVAYSYNSLGLNEDFKGNIKKAKEYFSLAHDILNRNPLDSKKDIAFSLMSMGNVCEYLGLFKKAENYYLECLEIRKNLFGENSFEYLSDLNTIGHFFYDNYKLKSSEKYLLELYDRRERLLGVNNLKKAPSFENIGFLYSRLGNLEKSKDFFQRSIDIRERWFGSVHSDIKDCLYGLADMYRVSGNKERYIEYLRQYVDMDKKLLKKNFPTMTDFYREKYLELEASRRSACTGFFIDQYGKLPGVSEDGYNAQLFYKGILVNSTKKWKERLRNHSDTALVNQFERWEQLHRRIGYLLGSGDSALVLRGRTLEESAEDMEKDLLKKSKDFASVLGSSVVEWKDVQKKLKKGEAAVELVRCQKYGLLRYQADSSDPKLTRYPVWGLTDTVWYAAYIVRPESRSPEMVLLENGNLLEGKWLQDYQKAILSRGQDLVSYKRFWEKLGSALQDVKRIYISPDGVFHQINLNTLFNPNTKRYLVEEKDLRLVTSTKDLVEEGRPENERQAMNIVGFSTPVFSGPMASIATTERALPSSVPGRKTAGLSPLPGSQKEWKAISDLLLKKGWDVKDLSSDPQVKASVQRFRSPRVLHIASHGFFEPDTAGKTNSLLRSGIVLGSGTPKAADTTTNQPNDGILTAYEAMNLNLDNTDLVVLSACETGLGEIKNGEGVYGLQRAFKVAGARSLIMSLWKVNDEATRELMVAFYKNWLTGTSKRDAFRKAQKELKVKYPNPYYWGAFVMVGE